MTDPEDRFGPRIPGDDTAVLRHALDLNPQGWALEFGTGSGGTARIIAARMPLLTFDSLEGLPEHWRPGFDEGMFRQDKVPQIENCTVVVGLYADTLPAFDWPDEPIGLVHLDADLYSSTVQALDAMGHLIQPGTLVVFDEYYGYDGAEDHEEKAWQEFAMRELLIYEPVCHGREQVLFRVLGRGERVDA